MPHVRLVWKGVHMSANGIDRKALEQLHAESMGEQASYYRRPFMVLWAAVQ